MDGHVSAPTNLISETKYSSSLACLLTSDTALPRTYSHSPSPLPRELCAGMVATSGVVTWEFLQQERWRVDLWSEMGPVLVGEFVLQLSIRSVSVGNVLYVLYFFGKLLKPPLL